MTVPILHSGTDLELRPLNAKLHRSSDVKTVGVITGRTAITSLHVHSPSSPMRRLDLLSWEATVIPANQRGQTARPTGRAKTGVRDLQATVFCAVSLAIGRRNVLPVAGYNLCWHRYLSSKNRQKTDYGAVCPCM